MPFWWAHCDLSMGTRNPNTLTHTWFAQDGATYSDQYLTMSSPVTLSG